MDGQYAKWHCPSFVEMLVYPSKASPWAWLGKCQVAAPIVCQNVGSCIESERYWLSDSPCMAHHWSSALDKNMRSPVASHGWTICQVAMPIICRDAGLSIQSFALDMDGQMPSGGAHRLSTCPIIHPERMPSAQWQLMHRPSLVTSSGQEHGKLSCILWMGILPSLIAHYLLRCWIIRPNLWMAQWQLMEELMRLCVGGNGLLFVKQAANQCRQDRLGQPSLRICARRLRFLRGKSVSTLDTLRLRNREPSTRCTKHTFQTGWRPLCELSPSQKQWHRTMLLHCEGDHRIPS